MGSSPLNFDQEVGGVISESGALIGATAALSSALATGGALAIGTATLGIGAAVFGIYELLSKLIGPDPNNVPASEIEQIFELAGWNLENLTAGTTTGNPGNAFEPSGGPGLISQAECLAGFQAFLGAVTTYEQQAESQYHDVTPFSAAIVNATNVIQEQANAVNAMPAYPDPTGALNFTQCQSYFVTTAQVPGAYSQSVSAAAQVALTYLQSLNRTVAQSVASAASSLISSAANTAQALTGTGSPELQSVVASTQSFIAANPGIACLLIAVGVIILFKVVL